MRLGTAAGISTAAAAFGASAPFRTAASPPDVDGPPLRFLADKLGLRIGAPFWTRCGSCDQDPDLDQLCRREFNTSIVYHAWGEVEPAPGVFNFAGLNYWYQRYRSLGADNVVLYGVVDPIAVAGPFANPDWLRDMSRSAMIDALQAYVAAVVTFSRNKMSSIVLVAETNSKPGWDILYDALGVEYVEIAFAAARKADPAAVLAYGDYDNHTRSLGRYAVTKDIVDRLRKQNLIDLVGIECFVWAPWTWRKDEVVACLQSYGVPVAMTEFRVELQAIDGPFRYQVEADLYRTFLEAALESGVCHDFIFGAPADGMGGEPSPNDPALFDTRLNPKPAYYATQAVLQAAVDRKYAYRNTLPLVSSDR